MIDVLKNFNLLLVEDDNTIRKHFKHTLQNYFRTVHEAHNGTKALEVFERERIHMIMSDYVMPLMDGADFISEIRKRDRHIPITIISNYSEKEMLIKCIPLNLMGYLTKPLNFPTLKKFLHEKAVPALLDVHKPYACSKENQFDFAANKLTVGEEVFTLTKLEAALIDLLASSNAVFSPESIGEHLYGVDNCDTTGVKNLIYRIKKKYRFHAIKNIKGVGYTLERRIDA